MIHLTQTDLVLPRPMLELDATFAHVSVSIGSGQDVTVCCVRSV